MRTRRIALLGALAATLIFPTSAGADTVQVNSDDDGIEPGCSLREAIETFDSGAPVGDCAPVAGPGTDTVTFAPGLSGATITLNGTQIDISTTMNIVGPGMNELTVTADRNSRVFLIAGGATTVEVSGLETTEGEAPVDSPGQVRGGCVRVDGATVVLRDVRVNDCAATVSGTGEQFADGGGVYNTGILTIDRSLIDGNIAGAINSTGNETGARARGSGVFTEGALTITDSTIAGNQAQSTDNGTGESFAIAGVFHNGTQFTMRRSTVSGNEAFAEHSGATGDRDLRAAGLHLLAHTTIELSTIAENITNVSGGGVTSPSGVLVDFGASPLTIRSSTIALNGPTTLTDIDGVNFFIRDETATLTNTIVSDPVGGGENCVSLGAGAIGTGGFNVDFSPAGASCFDTPAATDLTTNPLLSADGLAGNGGPTETIALQPTSPAVDQGSSAGDTDPTEDQRGLTRPALFSGIADAAGGNGADIGAYEVQPACAGQPTPSASCTTPAPPPVVTPPPSTPATTGQRAAALKKCKKKQGKKRKSCIKRAKKLPV